MFESIPIGSSVYLDANILVYAFLETSAECIQLVRRCREEDFHGILGAHILSEVCHRTMCYEAGEKLGKEQATAKDLKAHPEITSSLTRYSAFLDDLVREGNLLIIELSEGDLVASRKFRDEYGLLTNDSITAHVVKEWGIDAIATHDDDFDRTDIQVYKPSDI